MMRVRLASGATIDYPTATFLRYTERSWELYTAADQKQWVASLSPAQIVAIETDRSATYHAPLEPTDEKLLDTVLTYIRPLARSYPRTVDRLKDELSQWNAKSHYWKD